MDPLDYLRAFRQRWKIVLACLLVALAVAWITTPARPDVVATRTTTYDATATLLRDPDSQQSLGYVALFITKGQVPELVAEKVGYKGDPAVLASTIVVTPVADVGTISIQATGNDGPEAAKLANTFATELLAYLKSQRGENRTEAVASLEKSLNETSAEIAGVQDQLSADPGDVVLKAQRAALTARYQTLFQELQSQFANVGTTTGFTMLQRATPIPSATALTSFTAPATRSGRLRIAGLAGLVLGLVLALLLDRFDTRLRRRDEIQQAMNVPVLAEVPRRARSDRRSMLFLADDPGGAQAEAFRSLRSAMMLLPSRPLLGAEVASESRRSTTDAPRVILVVSARAGAGKTTVAANFAAVLAESGKRVLALDCDFRNPSLHKMLDVPWGPGLSDLWDAEASQLLTVSRPTTIPNVRLVTAGNSLDRPLALPTKIAGLVQEARGLADMVVIDAGPLLTANEAIDLMPYVDSVLVVVRSGRTTRDQAHRSVELLARMRVPVSGVVVNATPRAGQPWQRVSGRLGSDDRTEALTSKSSRGEQ